MPEDFSEFEDYLQTMEPGLRHPLANILRYRQGADVSSWATPGATKYIPASWNILVGSNKWTGGAETSGVKAFNFAAPFKDTPIVIASLTDTTPVFQEVRLM